MLGRACALVKGHGNEKRRAEAVVRRIMAGGMLTRRDRYLDLNWSRKVTLLIELPTSTSRQLAKWCSRYGYAMRIAKPRRSSSAAKKKAQPLATHPPPQAPPFAFGKVVCWRLDL